MIWKFCVAVIGSAAYAISQVWAGIAFLATCMFYLGDTVFSLVRLLLSGVFGFLKAGLTMYVFSLLRELARPCEQLLKMASYLGKQVLRWILDPWEHAIKTMLLPLLIGVLKTVTQFLTSIVIVMEQLGAEAWEVGFNLVSAGLSSVGALVKYLLEPWQYVIPHLESLLTLLLEPLRDFVSSLGPLLTSFMTLTTDWMYEVMVFLDDAVSNVVPTCWRLVLLSAVVYMAAAVKPTRTFWSLQASQLGPRLFQRLLVGIVALESVNFIVAAIGGVSLIISEDKLGYCTRVAAATVIAAIVAHTVSGKLAAWNASPGWVFALHMMRVLPMKLMAWICFPDASNPVLALVGAVHRLLLAVHMVSALVAFVAYFRSRQPHAQMTEEIKKPIW